jgi:hypothetical protein
MPPRPRLPRRRRRLPSDPCARSQCSPAARPFSGDSVKKRGGCTGRGSRPCEERDGLCEDETAIPIGEHGLSGAVSVCASSTSRGPRIRIFLRTTCRDRRLRRGGGPRVKGAKTEARAPRSYIGATDSQSADLRQAGETSAQARTGVVARARSG